MLGLGNEQPGQTLQEAAAALVGAFHPPFKKMSDVG